MAAKMAEMTNATASASVERTPARWAAMGLAPRLYISRPMRV